MHSLPCCPLCNERDSITAFAGNAARRYLICAQCDLVFMPPQYHPTADVERRRYDLHRNDPADPGYRQFLAQLANPLRARLPAGSTGLDFGCGPTAVLAVLLDEAGFRMSRYDPFYAPDRGVLAQTYDFIACSEAMEHFFQPAREWELFLRLAKPGGWLGIMTLLREPETDFAGWWYREDITHVCFYSRRTFEWLARRDGLAVEFEGKSVVLLKKPLDFPARSPSRSG